MRDAQQRRVAVLVAGYQQGNSGPEAGPAAQRCHPGLPCVMPNSAELLSLLQGISKATLGLKLGQLLSDATKAVDSKLYPPKARQGQKRKRPSQDEARAAANDHADDHAELDSILENSMATLGSEDDQDVGHHC